QASDIIIHAQEIAYHKENLNKHMSLYTGQPYEKIEKDTDRDNFMSAFEAKEYGLIDEIQGVDTLKRAIKD
ncbi:ATP-dependent Clp protease proteolytic subunit, partial [Vibrio splendidus]